MPTGEDDGKIVFVTLLRGLVRGRPINRVRHRICIPDSTIPDHPTNETVAEAGEVSLDIDVETVDSDSDDPGGGWMEGSGDAAN